jgi:hypothetical protein
MLRIDETPPPEAIQQFAGQVPNIAPKVRHFLDESIVGDQSDEFYLGLLAGLMFAYQLYGQSPNAVEVNGCTMALVAKRLEGK